MGIIIFIQKYFKSTSNAPIQCAWKKFWIKAYGFFQNCMVFNFVKIIRPTPNTNLFIKSINNKLSNHFLKSIDSEANEQMTASRVECKRKTCCAGPVYIRIKTWIMMMVISWKRTFATTLLKLILTVSSPCSVMIRQLNNIPRINA